MSVVGIDFGNLNTVIAVARNRGIDVIANEASNRLTPSMVGFAHKQRYMGEQAKSNEISNFRNTVHTLKRMAGRPSSDPEIQAIESRFVNCQLTADERTGEAAAAVHYLGEHREFTFAQLCAAFLTKVKDITAHETRAPVSDVVLSVPGWFGDRQRRAVVDAAQIAGLNVLRLQNDGTAVALAYGIPKTDLPEPTAKPRKVVFVDIGHSSTQASCVEFVKGQLRVRAAAYDRNLGGRDFDDALASKVAVDAEKKYKGMDLRSNKRAMYRLRLAAERAKKVLSANSSTVLAVESLVEDRDVSIMVERADFEALVAPLIDRVLGPLEKAMSVAGWSAEEVDAVELVGGSTRIPAVKAKFAHFFGDDLSKSPLEMKIQTTMNQDEAVARGNAFMCAMISPVFKVREFSVQDWNPHAVEISWDGSLTSSGEAGVMEAFPLGNTVPSTKQLTFYRKLPNPLPPSGVDFTITLAYLPAAADMQLLPGLGHGIGQWTVTGIKPVEDVDRDRACVRVKAKLSADGVFSMVDAQLVEEKMVVEAPEEKKKDEAVPMETDQPAAADAAAPGTPASETSTVPPPEPPKPKKVVKKHPLQIVAATPSLSAAQLSTFRDVEMSMASQDKLVADTAFARNALEEYIYFARGKLDDTWAPFGDEATKSKLKSNLATEEEWLYTEEGEEAQKSLYQERLAAVKKLGDPIQFRARESELRPSAEKALRDVINSFALQLSATDDRFAHIAAADLQKCKDEVDRVNNWLNGEVARQNQRAKHQDVVVTAEQIDTAKGQLVSFVTPIITRPKPAPKKEEKKDDEKKDAGANGTTPAADGAEAPATGGEKKADDDTEMD